MYTYPLVSQTEFYQGDIINGYPFLNLGSIKALEIGDENNLTESNLAIDAETVKVSAPVDIRNVMIVSQTCDAQRRENLLICPIYTLDEYIAASHPNADKLRTLRGGKIYYWLYLPGLSGALEESFVDLQQLIYVPRAQIEPYKSSRILSLDDLGRHRLAWSMATFLGRPT